MVRLEVDMKDLVRLREKIEKIFSRTLFEELGQYLTSSTIRKIQSNIPPENAPLTKAYKKNNLTLRDTGRLMSSITYRAHSHQVEVGTNVLYGRIQQLGGTIRPKKAKKLWIPAGWETRRLMRRFGMNPKSVIEGLKASGYRVWISRSKKAVLYQKKGGRPEVLFVLKDEVTIPARSYLKIDALDKKMIQGIVKRWIG